jgi:hypothetical protein
MTTTEIDDRLHASDARLRVLHLVGQGEVSSPAIIIQLRGQGFADREVDDAVNALFDEGVLVRGLDNAVRRYLAA